MTTHINTKLVQLGNRKDPSTGAVVAPIHLATTYAHPGLGQSTGYDYTRTNNPTRDILEEGLAALEGGERAVVTSSGMSAIQLAFQLFKQGSHFLVLVLISPSTRKISSIKYSLFIYFSIKSSIFSGKIS